ncbi:MAG: peptidoglycan editing factor PgeF [Betaproteobacteria bacterium]|nr:peptidoglycan editing factor PgeF [Betaproteobacteria bacterium]
MPASQGWIVPDWPVAANVRAFATTRAGGASRGPYTGLNLATRVGDDPRAVARNRDVLRRYLPADPIWLEQVHGTDVVEAERAASSTRADGVVARTRHHVCAVLTADCLPVLMAGRTGGVVAVAHAGWRGLANGIIEATLARMGVSGAEVVAWLGPGISQAAYEVGRDVYESFVSRDPEVRGAFRPGAPGKYQADLYALARCRLGAVGVTAVHGGGFCTYGDADRFYSYRRDGPTGRMATVIWMD